MPNLFLGDEVRAVGLGMPVEEAEVEDVVGQCEVCGGWGLAEG